MTPRLICWATGLLLAGAAQAQAFYPGHLPTEAMVHDALAQAPAVQAADAMVQSALAHAQGLRAGMHETTISATGQRRWIREGGRERFAEGQIAVERAVRLGGKAEADAGLADATVRMSEISARDARHETARQLLALWFAAQRAGQTRDAAQDNARAADELATLTQGRLRAGDASRLDTELAQAEKARTQADLATAQAAEQSALAELQARFPAIGKPTLGDKALALPSLPDELSAQMRTRYIEHSHAYLLAQAEEAYALHQARRTDLERRPDPTIGVFAGSERGGAERVLGLSLSLPLGSAYRQAQAQAATAEAQAALSRRLTVEQRLGAEFDTLWQQAKGRHTAALAQAHAARLQRSATERGLRAYRAGESGLAELLTIQRIAAQALLAQRQAQSEALESHSRLLLDLRQLWDLE
ncbi:TolC family protein [Comamonas composti]|uniref:TolC family protein n=1 Tax=Comamonas composti TaxID=408558 RepID=UPI00040FB199|nr:TolC family protein [Comamonas composti]